MFWLRAVFRSFHHTLFNARQKHNAEAKEKTEKEAGHSSQFILWSVFYLQIRLGGKEQQERGTKIVSKTLLHWLSDSRLII